MPVTAQSLLLVLVMSFTLYGCNHKPLAKPTIIIPEDVNSYVINNEKQVANLKPNTQKKIFWYTAVNKKSEYSLVFIHGFAGSRLVQEPALSNLAHKFKANYFATRIRGHGQPSQHIHEATAEGTCKLWPNPANAVVRMQADAAPYQVYDAAGKLVQPWSSALEIDVRDWLAGTYIAIQANGRTSRFNVAH